MVIPHGLKKLLKNNKYFRHHNVDIRNYEKLEKIFKRYRKN